MDKNELLTTAVNLGASDIIVLPGAPPMARIEGHVVPITADLPVLGAAECREFIYSGLSDVHRTGFEASFELDYSFSIPGVSRFRANVFKQRAGVSAVYRVIPTRIPDPQGLGLTEHMLALTDLPNGLVIITGPPGSGKSTTLASMIDQINAKHRKNIITIEDPVEFVYERKRSIIHQREVGEDTKSFKEALRHALREAPDVILIGELRDYETIQLAVTAAETGHLCISTLHTRDCASIFNRIIDVFPSEQQSQIRTQIALTLQAVIAQILLPRADGKGRIAAREFMVMTSAINSGIREDKPHVIYSAIQTGKKLGMQTMDQHLAQLVAQGTVRHEDALAKAKSPDGFQQLVVETAAGLSAGKTAAVSKK